MLRGAESGTCLLRPVRLLAEIWRHQACSQQTRSRRTKVGILTLLIASSPQTIVADKMFGVLLGFAAATMKSRLICSSYVCHMPRHRHFGIHLSEGQQLFSFMRRLKRYRGVLHRLKAKRTASRMWWNTRGGRPWVVITFLTQAHSLKKR
jgi:hypothetical protein